MAGGISNQKELEEYKEAHPATEVGSQLSPGGAVEDVLGAIFPTGFAPLPKVPFLRRDIYNAWTILAFSRSPLCK